MPVQLKRLSIWVLISFVLSFSSAAHAVVKEVTLFPNAAKVTETAKVHPQCSNNENCRAIITLPPQADTESLIVSLPSNSRIKIADLQVRAIPRQDEARISELRKQIAKLKEDRKNLQAKIQSLDVQLQFWQMQTKAKTKNVADADNLAAAIGKNVKKSHQEKFAIEAEVEKIDIRLKELQDNLNQAAGKKETAWEATLTFSGPVAGDVALTYNYNLNGCGWIPLYRIEALPADNTISFSWDAELWQSSGEDWKQVQINLATLQPVITLTPPEIPSWIIKLRQNNIYKSLRKESMAKSAAPMELRSFCRRKSGLSHLGNCQYDLFGVVDWQKNNSRRFPAAAENQRRKLAGGFPLSCPSRFGSPAFIRAHIKLANSVEIPSGQAIFLIDGALLGKRNFSFAGTEETLFFGTSPLISVTSSSVANKSGAKTVFQNKQTQLWQWQIEASNSSGKSIKLMIEEPVPQARDERIRLTFKQNPEPQEKDHSKFVWIIEVPPREKKTIQNIIELEAPKDLDLDLGWRR